jgi:beta-lactamase class D
MPFVHWGKDQTLRSALILCPLVLQRAGAERRPSTDEKYVRAFNYGNKDVSGRVDNFWLNNVLKISADEQVEFLKAFYSGRLPVSKRSTGIVKDILVIEKHRLIRSAGKQAVVPLTKELYRWFVGYLEAAGNVYFFATNIEGASYAEIRDKRIDLTRQILIASGYLPT